MPAMREVSIVLAIVSNQLIKLLLVHSIPCTPIRVAGKASRKARPGAKDGYPSR